MNCWSLDMHERPSFSQIFDMFDSNKFVDKYKKIFNQYKEETNYKLRKTEAVSDIILTQNVDDMKSKTKHTIRTPTNVREIKVMINADDLITDITEDF